MIAGVSEGAIIRQLLAHAATFVRPEAVRRQPDLPSRPEWAGGVGTMTGPADRQAWANAVRLRKSRQNDPRVVAVDGYPKTAFGNGFTPDWDGGDVP